MTPDQFYDKFSVEYDRLAAQHEWYSPDLLFGLTYPLIPDNGIMIDLGIGTGLSSTPFKRVGYNIIGIDQSNEMLERCRIKKIASSLILHNLLITPWPIENNKFNLVISNGVFYFFYDLDCIFLEVSRILKSGGIFAFNVEPNYDLSKNGYINCDNSVISNKIDQADGLMVYRHSHEYILKKLKMANFIISRQVLYHAYYSPTEKRDVYFKAYIAKKAL